MDSPLLHVELFPNDKMNFKIKGDPVLVAKMVRTAMQHSQEIAAAMIACVVDYCLEEHIDCGDMQYMVKFKK